MVTSVCRMFVSHHLRLLDNRRRKWQGLTIHPRRTLRGCVRLRASVSWRRTNIGASSRYRSFYVAVSLNNELSVGVRPFYHHFGPDFGCWERGLLRLYTRESV